MECFGFIAPLNTYENITINEQINSKTRQMINDFLREQIPVYWIATNGTVKVKDIENIKEEKDVFFEKGTFIIPFTTDNNTDIKISAIIFDYNQSAEINEYTNLHVPVYLLLEKMNVSGYLLSEVKIVFFKSSFNPHISEYFFLEIARKCGFLTFEFFNEYDTKRGNLDNNMFNVLIYGWGNRYTYLSWFIEDIFYDVSKSIRKFVENGGGYIGSCGGPYRAACEVTSNVSIGSSYRHIKYNCTRQAYNPNLNSYGLLAIADVAVEEPNILLEAIESKIVNTSHPVSYSLDPVVTDWVYGGPKYYRIGKNSEVIALFYNTSTHVDNTPSWVSSKFGKGRVVLFSTHPELVDYEFNHTGKTVHSNALFYTTASNVTEVNISNSKTILFILDVWEKTSNLSLGGPGTQFISITNKIKKTTSDIENLSVYLIQVMNRIEAVARQNDISPISIGHRSVNISYKTLQRFIQYYAYGLGTIDMMEKVYSLLENDTDFVNRTIILKNDLNEKINNSQEIIQASQSIYQKLNIYLTRYENLIWRDRSIPLELLLITTVNKLMQQISLGYYYIPQIFFNSLKLLRSSWYAYETNICITK